MSESSEEDLLSSIMGTCQLRGGIYAHPTYCGHWQFGTSGWNHATFHVLGRGHCWLHTRLQATPRLLQAGDLVVFPRDAWHLLSGERGLKGEGMRVQMEGATNFTTLVCGYFEFLTGNKNPVLDALPELIVVPREEAGAQLGTLGRLLLEEALNGNVTRIVLDKLVDILFVMVVRHHVTRAADRRGLLAELADTRIRNALDAIHGDPGAPWTVEKLAQEAAMSRTTFAQRFPELLGKTPMEYVTRWRMAEALRLLRDPAQSVACIAEYLGYCSEASFRRAFKRVHEFAPGKVRHASTLAPPRPEVMTRHDRCGASVPRQPQEKPIYPIEPDSATTELCLPSH